MQTEEGRTQKGVIPTIYSLRVFEERFHGSICLALVAFWAGDEIDNLGERASRECGNDLRCLRMADGLAELEESKCRRGLGLTRLSSIGRLWSFKCKVGSKE